jgi:quercetin dioxygenase-like cupin family protein
MTTVLKPEEVEVVEEGDGWQQLGLAGSELFGFPAMVARRWIMKAGASGPELLLGDQDQLLYVIAGGGQAIVDGGTFDLAEESVLWLEPGERYRFIAGPAGLEILQGYAPVE